MSFLSPISALITAGLTVPALVALYFLKLRRRQVAVPTTLLWQKAIQDMQVNTPFQRLRRNLLLFLQLLILAALLLAMARPALWATANPGQRVVIVVDQSASMNAPVSPGGPTRLSKAKEAASQIVDNFSANQGEGTGGAMVVAFADRPQVQANFTADPSRLRRAVDRIQRTDQLSRLAPTLKLIQPYAQRAAAQQQSELMVHVITDGRVHQAKQALPSLSGAKLNFVQVAETDRPDNLALVAASARRSFETPARVQLFARLANYGPEPIDTQLTLRVGGSVSRVQEVTVPAGKMRSGASGPTLNGESANTSGGSTSGGSASGDSTSGGSTSGGSSSGGSGSGGDAQNSMTFRPGTQSVQFEFVLTGEALVQLSHNHDDALAADDQAQLTLAPAKRLRALLVTEGNAFLQRVIESVGVRQLLTMSPDEYRNQDPAMLRRRGASGGASGGGGGTGPGSGFDVIIFDQYAPDALPPTPTLSFGVAQRIDELSINAPEGETPGGQVILEWARRHPIMRYVTLSDVNLADPRWLAVPPEATVLATAQRGPVMAQVTESGRPHVVTSFPVLQSNWPMQVSFPVFVSNVLQQLGLGGLLDEAGVSFRPGETAVVSVRAAIEQLRYEGPAPLTTSVTEGRAVLGPFTQVGVYQTDTAVEPPHDQLAVNLLDSLESDLRPASQLEVAAKSVKSKPDAKAVEQPIWPWFLWAALAVLMLEWLFYIHRMRV